MKFSDCGQKFYQIAELEFHAPAPYDDENMHQNSEAAMRSGMDQATCALRIVSCQV